MSNDLNLVDSKVLELLLTGCDNPTIARELGMKERTVKARFTQMFRRFGIDGRSCTKRVQLAMQFRQRRNIPGHIGLSRKQQTITELVRCGLTNREIAEQIGTTEDVVKNYLRQIFDKTGMGNRLELALWTAQ